MKGEIRSFRELERRVRAYFDSCEESNDFPDEAGLILYLGISEEMYEKYQTSKLKRLIPYRLCLENARLRRESILVRRIYAADKHTPTGMFFLARQEENGGLTAAEPSSAVKESKKQTLEVKMSPSVSAFFE